MNSNKNTPLLLVTIAAISLGGGMLTLSTGCAATPTRESTGEYVDDSAITTKVKAAMAKDDTVKAMDVMGKHYP